MPTGQWDRSKTKEQRAAERAQASAEAKPVRKKPGPKPRNATPPKVHVVADKPVQISPELALRLGRKQRTKPGVLVRARRLPSGDMKVVDAEVRNVALPLDLYHWLAVTAQGMQQSPTELLDEILRAYIGKAIGPKGSAR